MRMEAAGAMGGGGWPGRQRQWVRVGGGRRATVRVARRPLPEPGWRLVAGVRETGG